MALRAHLFLHTPGPLCWSVSCLSSTRHKSGMVCAWNAQPAGTGSRVWKEMSREKDVV